MDKLRASASLPIVSQIVEVDGKKLLDGGTADSIPIFQFRRMGYRKDIVVLTRPEGYVKEEDSMLKLEAIRYKEYPEYVKRIAMRHLYYNKTLEKDDKKIQAMYDLGVYDAQNKIEEVVEFLK